MFSLFASEAAGPAVHVAPAPVFEIGSWTITNSILYGWLCTVIMIIFFVWVARKVTVKPKGGVVQFVEAGVEFIRNLVENAFDDKNIGRKYVPYFVTLFFIILINNWLGLLPLVGEGIRTEHSPAFRPMTGDLNATLGIGLITMILVYVASIKEVGGIGKYVSHFFVGSPKNPLYLVIGLIEIITDLTRVLSLSLRLFLNVAIGEIVIAVFAYLGGLISVALSPIAALPFFLLELGVAALQAYIFVLLGTMYLALSVNAANAHDDDHLTEDVIPETMPAKASGATS